MITSPLVSIIMPAYNAENYISEAIESVLTQEHANFELLVINDGSTDSTMKIIQSFDDPRIIKFEQKNKGVSAARNIGLDNMLGKYFCFLDADDLMAEKSISSRVKKFKNSIHATFVDGHVEIRDIDLINLIQIWRPDYFGEPLPDLLGLTGNSFFGQTWMLSSYEFKEIRFDTTLSHCEDLMFYIECSRKTGYYEFVNEVILIHREHPTSASSNLLGIANGYFFILQKIKEMAFEPQLIMTYKRRITRVLVFSFLKQLRLEMVVRTVTKIWFS